MKSRYVIAGVFGLYAWLAAIPVTAGEFRVVASIRPVQWLVEALLPPGTEVQTLLPVGQSAHDYALRPGDMAAVQSSDLLVWVGPALEPWLIQVVARLPEGRTLALQPAVPAPVVGRLQESAGVTTGAGHPGDPAHHDDHHHDGHDDDAHNDDHGSGHHHPGEMVAASLTADPHIWLDPTQMAGLADVVAMRLQARLPEQAAEIRERLQVFQLAMATLDSELQARLVPLKGIGFVVYHDSYGPLVKRYGLDQRAAVWRHEAMTTGARDRAALRTLLQEGSVQCVFYEPEYGREAVTSWLAQNATGVAVAELDPLGGTIPGGDGAYSRLMHNLADDISRCLQQSVPGKQ